MGDERFRWTEKLPGSVPRHVGAILVLRDDRVAVFAPDPTSTGSPSKYLGGEPLGYLPAAYEWAVNTTREKVEPSGKLDQGVATFTIGLPLLDKRGEADGRRALRVTIQVPVPVW